MPVPPASVQIMSQKDLFLMSDAALRDVIDHIQPDQLALAAPAAWSRAENPTLLDILAGHARDEAWVPDVLAGRTIEEVGTAYDGDLLGDDPIASYDRLNDAATSAVNAQTDLDAVAHLSYGDYPVRTFFEHTSYYRAFQAPAIAKFIGLDWHMSPALVDLLRETVEPQLDELRSYGIFPPEVEAPEGADAETRLLARTGFLEQ